MKCIGKPICYFFKHLGPRCVCELNGHPHQNIDDGYVFKTVNYNIYLLIFHNSSNEMNDITWKIIIFKSLGPIRDFWQNGNIT